MAGVKNGELSSMKKQLSSILFMLSFFLAACQNMQTPTAVPSAADVALPGISSDGSGSNAAPCTNSGAYPGEGYLAGCMAVSVQSGYPAAPPLEPVTIPQGEEWYAEVLPPGPGKATVTGVIISEGSGKPVVNAPVALAEVYYQDGNGAFVLDGAFSPHTVSDSDGRFAFVDIPAMDYVLVIGNPEINDYQIIEDLSGKARVWTAAADNILDMSTIQVNLRLWE